MDERSAQCPTCKTAVAVDPAERPADFPFCSERCRLVDLGRWLNGAYAIPVAAPAPEDIEELLARAAREKMATDDGAGQSTE